MAAEPAVWVDVEDAAREWVRDAVASIGRRGFFGLNNDAAFPQVSLFRVSGTDDACRVQFNVYGTSKKNAAGTVAELCTAAEALTNYDHDGTRLHAATVDSVRWQPDPASDHPRYVVDVLVVATAL